MKKVYVIKYASKWAVRYETGPNQALRATEEEAIDLAWRKAKQNGSDLVYLETKPGKFKKLEPPEGFVLTY
jgi:hypothetical protein